MNEARDLLNFVDEHKEEMKDDTYKTIVDKLKPIHDKLKDTQMIKCEITYAIEEPHFQKDDKNKAELHVSTESKVIQAFLTEEEYNIVEDNLAEELHRLYMFPYKARQEYAGIKHLQNIKDVLTKTYQIESFEIHVNKKETIDFEIEYHTTACIVNIKKWTV